MAESKAKALFSKMNADQVQEFLVKSVFGILIIGLFIQVFGGYVLNRIEERRKQKQAPIA